MVISIELFDERNKEQIELNFNINWHLTIFESERMHIEGRLA